ncbi:hypothetical protein [Vibrio splendidus]|uniref:hypothetical protein n=1 Tax=Vibrio splendidus TaxID=29497 RepID=UPI00031BCE8C|nr:hypothetical protein [Vibrio splendidus]
MILKLLTKGWFWIVLSTSVFFFGSLLYVSMLDESSEVKYIVSKSGTSADDDYSKFKNDISNFQQSIYDYLSYINHNRDINSEVVTFIKAFDRLNSRDVYEIHNHCDMYNLFFNGQLFRQLSSSDLDELVEQGGIKKLIDSKFTNNLSRLCSLDNLTQDKSSFELFINEFNKESSKSLFYKENEEYINSGKSESEFIYSLKAERVDKVNADKYYLKYISNSKEVSYKVLGEYVKFINDRVGIELVSMVSEIKLSYIEQVERKEKQLVLLADSEEYLSEKKELESELEVIKNQLKYYNSLTFQPVVHVFYEIVPDYSSEKSVKVSYGWIFIFVNTIFGFLLGLSLALFKKR